VRFQQNFWVDIRQELWDRTVVVLLQRRRVGSGVIQPPLYVYIYTNYATEISAPSAPAIADVSCSDASIIIIMCCRLSHSPQKSLKSYTNPSRRWGFLEIKRTLSNSIPNRFIWAEGDWKTKNPTGSNLTAQIQYLEIQFYFIFSFCFISAGRKEKVPDSRLHTSSLFPPVLFTGPRLIHGGYSWLRNGNDTPFQQEQQPGERKKRRFNGLKRSLLFLLLLVPDVTAMTVNDAERLNVKNYLK